MELIKNYQILIAGGFGFLGVMLTILANGYFGRAIHKRELNTKRKSISSALRAELSITRSSYQARLEQISSFNKSDIKLTVAVFSDVYDSFQSEIGILETDTIEQIVSTYLLLKELPFLLGFLGKRDEAGFIVVSIAHREKVMKYYQIRLESVEKSLKLLNCA